MDNLEYSNDILANIEKAINSTNELKQDQQEARDQLTVSEESYLRTKAETEALMGVIQDALVTRQMQIRAESKLEKASTVDRYEKEQIKQHAIDAERERRAENLKIADTMKDEANKYVNYTKLLEADGTPMTGFKRFIAKLARTDHLKKALTFNQNYVDMQNAADASLTNIQQIQLNSLREVEDLSEQEYIAKENLRVATEAQDLVTAKALSTQAGVEKLTQLTKLDEEHLGRLTTIFNQQKDVIEKDASIAGMYISLEQLNQYAGSIDNDPKAKEAVIKTFSDAVEFWNRNNPGKEKSIASLSGLVDKNGRFNAELAKELWQDDYKGIVATVGARIPESGKYQSFAARLQQAPETANVTQEFNILMSRLTDVEGYNVTDEAVKLAGGLDTFKLLAPSQQAELRLKAKQDMIAKFDSDRKDMALEIAARSQKMIVTEEQLVGIGLDPALATKVMKEYIPEDFKTGAVLDTRKVGEGVTDIVDNMRKDKALTEPELNVLFNKLPKVFSELATRAIEDSYRELYSDIPRDQLKFEFRLNNELDPTGLKLDLDLRDPLSWQRLYTNRKAAQRRRDMQRSTLGPLW